jgi:hypothetical protein
MYLNYADVVKKFIFRYLSVLLLMVLEIFL